MDRQSERVGEREEGEETVPRPRRKWACCEHLHEETSVRGAAAEKERKRTPHTQHRRRGRLRLCSSRKRPAKDESLREESTGPYCKQPPGRSPRLAPGHHGESDLPCGTNSALAGTSPPFLRPVPLFAGRTLSIRRSTASTEQHRTSRTPAQPTLAHTAPRTTTTTRTTKITRRRPTRPTTTTTTTLHPCVNTRRDE